MGIFAADYHDSRISDRLAIIWNRHKRSFGNHREPCISDPLAIDSDQCRPLSGNESFFLFDQATAGRDAGGTIRALISQKYKYVQGQYGHSHFQLCFSEPLFGLALCEKNMATMPVLVFPCRKTYPRWTNLFPQ